MTLDSILTWELLLAAFAGGAFGAAIGALQSFTLAGLVVVIGEVYALVHRSLGVEPAIDLTGTVAFGVVLGPHVAFGGGAAAVAYAATRSDIDTGFVYHDAKHVTRGLGSRPDVLAVGGAFGAFGYAVAAVSGHYGVPTDPVALGVVVSAIAHRLLFGYSVIGDVVGSALDMSPFEREQRRQYDGPDPSVEADGGTRLVVEPWLPYQYRWGDVAFLGLLVGVLGGYLAYLSGSAFLAFGLSVVALAFLCAGVDGIPVTHHMSLPASTVVVASAGPSVTWTTSSIPLGDALLLGAAFGLVGGLLGELSQRVFYAHAETHFDPPAASIVLTSLLIAVLALASVLPSAAWIPLP